MSELDRYKYFGEWVFYEDGNEADKEEARAYLRSWKKFLLRKLAKDLTDYEPVTPEDFGEQWIDRPAEQICTLGNFGTLGYKISFREKKLPCEL